MIGLNDQAASIVSQLENIGSLATVQHLRSEDNLRRRPAKLPEACLALYSATSKHNGRNLYNSTITWSVLVRSKKMDETGGALDLVDQVLDTLSGFQPPGCAPLKPGEVEYFNQDGRSDVSYLLFFSTTVTDVAVGNSC